MVPQEGFLMLPQPKEDIEYTVEEVTFVHEGVEYWADVTYGLEIDWEYDSGEPEVGIWGGWYARRVDQDVVKIRLYNEDGDLSETPVSPEFLKAVKGVVPKIEGHCLHMALGR